MKTILSTPKSLANKNVKSVWLSQLSILLAVILEAELKKRKELFSHFDFTVENIPIARFPAALLKKYGSLNNLFVLFLLGHLSYSCWSTYPHGLGYPLPYGDRVTNIRGGDAYTRGTRWRITIQAGDSFEEIRYIYIYIYHFFPNNL